MPQGHALMISQTPCRWRLFGCPSTLLVMTTSWLLMVKHHPLTSFTDMCLGTRAFRLLFLPSVLGCRELALNFLMMVVPLSPAHSYWPLVNGVCPRLSHARKLVVSALHNISAHHANFPQLSFFLYRLPGQWGVSTWLNIGHHFLQASKSHPNSECPPFPGVLARVSNPIQKTGFFLFQCYAPPTLKFNPSGTPLTPAIIHQFL